MSPPADAEYYGIRSGTMSKAFTKESDGDDEDDAPESAAPRHTGARYISPAGYKQLQSELDTLWRVERPRVTHEVELAAAHGDRSENAEYIYGKKRLREIDRRLRFLGEAPRERHGGRARRGTSRQGLLWGVCDGAGRGRAGVHLPLGGRRRDRHGKALHQHRVTDGRALLGKSVGEVVTVQRPKGDAEFTLRAIRYE